MPRVRGNPADKWTRRAAGAADDFAKGVADPRAPWAASTAGAKASYEAGVAAANARNGFQKGVQAAGDAKWQRKAAGIGAQRFPQGVQDATAEFAEGVAPYLQVISSTALPPRGPKGSPANLQRVGVLATALRNKKLQGG